MAPLDRTITLAQRDHAAVPVGEHLHFDVARMRQVLLEKHAAVAESGLGLARRRRERLGEARLRLDQAHPAAAAARRRFDDQRKSDPRRKLLRAALVDRLEPRHYRNARARRQAPRRDLVAQRRHHVRRRPDEDNSGLVHGASKLGPLGEKAVAGMDRVGAGGACGLKDRGNIEVALARLGRTDEARLIGCGDVNGVGVGFRVDRDGGEPEQACAANYPERYFAAVGDQQLSDAAAFHSARERSTWRTRCRAPRDPLGAARSTDTRAPRRPPALAVDAALENEIF